MLWLFMDKLVSLQSNSDLPKWKTFLIRKTKKFPEMENNRIETAQQNNCSWIEDEKNIRGEENKTDKPE